MSENSRWQKRVLALSVVFPILLAGCSQLTRRSGTPSRPATPGQTTTDEGFEQEAPPPPVREEEPRVAVILGPGGYRAFAHATVLKEFARSRIPVEKVIGFEWGALAGAFFALDGKAHEAEWKFYKLEKKDLGEQGFFTRKNEPQSMTALQKYFRDNFSGRDLSSFKVKFSCPSLSLQTGVVSFFEKGSAAAAMEMCVSYPPFWLPSRNAVAAGLSVADAAERLKREGYNVIVLVNVLDPGPIPLGRDDWGAQVLWNEVRRDIWAAKSRVTDVVEVDMKGIALFDLEARKSIGRAAEKAAQAAVKALAEKYGF